MNALSAYNEYNRNLALGRPDAPPRELRAAARPGQSPRYPRLGVYTGGGASHSWLWFATLAERLGLYDVSFLDHHRVAAGGLNGLDGLLVSGGDTFGMARALGPSGAQSLERFIRGGGLYLGACAGAYLVMRSSKEPLNHFNFVASKIANLSRDLPQPLMLPEKFKSAYGCDYVFHPVRESVLLESAGRPPFGHGIFEAPLYGGPAMLAAGPEVETLATYAGFTRDTRFLAPPHMARETLLGRAAVLRARLGQGTLYLLGPHFEHPHFTAANRLLAQAMHWDLPAGEARPTAQAELMPRAGAKGLLLEIKRQTSNARITAIAIEDHPARWLIGQKVYEPAKFRVFLEAIWTRLPALQKAPQVALPPGASQELPDALARLSHGLRLLKKELARDQDTTARASELLGAVQRAAGIFLKMYFDTALAGLREGPGGWLH